MSKSETYESPRKRRWGIVPLVILLFVLALVRYLPLNVALPDADAFSLSATDLPDTAKVGDPLTVTATLSYSPWRSFLADTGGYPIYIELIRVGDPDPVYAGVGQYSYLPAGGHWSDTATFTPNRPGNYTLRVSAYFYIGKQQYALELPERTITITE